MDDALLAYYSQELEYIREKSVDFASQYPKVAGRLGIHQTECADPYVERLLEGFSFLTARLRLRIDSEETEFTRNLLEVLFPSYLAPLPSAAIVQINLNEKEGSFDSNYHIPKGEKLRSDVAKGEQTACEFVTTQSLDLWPIKLDELLYLTNERDLLEKGLVNLPKNCSAIELGVSTFNSVEFSALSIDRLKFYLSGPDVMRNMLLTGLFNHLERVTVCARRDDETIHYTISPDQLRLCGLSQDEALLPSNNREFHSYKSLQEYFLLPESFSFIELCGLSEMAASLQCSELKFYFLFNKAMPQLEDALTKDLFLLNCVPVINLFHKKMDRLIIDNKTTEYKISPDKSKPRDFEIYLVQQVMGLGDNNYRQTILPASSADSSDDDMTDQYFYSGIRKKKHIASLKNNKLFRGDYLGSDYYLALMQGNHSAYSEQVKQISIDALCTNRNLVQSIPLGEGDTDFVIDINAPVESIHCLSKLTSPAIPDYENNTPVLINLLSMNYACFSPGEGIKNAQQLKKLISVFINTNKQAHKRTLESIQKLEVEESVRVVFRDNRIVHVRGTLLVLTIALQAYHTNNFFVLGCLLQKMFSTMVSINAYVELKIISEHGDVLSKWLPSSGIRSSL